MNPLVLATYNMGKKQEFKTLLQSMKELQLLDLADLAQPLTFVENGNSFYENAKMKAQATYQATSFWSLADDSGLEIDALDGAPGIYSARYSLGHPCESLSSAASLEQRNMMLVLEQLRKVPKQERTARFRCVLFLCGSAFQGEYATEGICEGRIEFEPRGTLGFGYDPIFVPALSQVCEKSMQEKTFAELPMEMKNTISHRAKAIALMVPILQNIFN